MSESVTLLETRSTNTGENVRFTRKLLVDRGWVIESVIAEQKPYMKRHTFATISKQLPEVALHPAAIQYYLDLCQELGVR